MPHRLERQGRSMLRPYLHKTVKNIIFAFWGKKPLTFAFLFIILWGGADLGNLKT